MYKFVAFGRTTFMPLAAQPSFWLLNSTALKQIECCAVIGQLKFDKVKDCAAAIQANYCCECPKDLTRPYTRASVYPIIAFLFLLAPRASSACAYSRGGAVDTGR